MQASDIKLDFSFIETGGYNMDDADTSASTSDNGVNANSIDVSGIELIDAGFNTSEQEAKSLHTRRVSRNSFDMTDPNELDAEALGAFIDDFESNISLGVFNGIIYSTAPNRDIHTFEMSLLPRNTYPIENYTTFHIQFPVHPSSTSRNPVLFELEHPDFIAKEDDGVIALIYAKREEPDITIPCPYCDNFSSVSPSCSSRCLNRAHEYADIYKIHKKLGLPFTYAYYTKMCYGDRAYLPFVVRMPPPFRPDPFRQGQTISLFQGVYKLNTDTASGGRNVVIFGDRIEIDLCQWGNWINIFHRIEYQKYIIAFYGKSAQFENSRAGVTSAAQNNVNNLDEFQAYTSHIVLHGHEELFYNYLTQQMSAEQFTTMINNYLIDVRLMLLECCTHCLFAGLKIPPIATCACRGVRLTDTQVHSNDIVRLRHLRLFQLFFYGHTHHCVAVYPSLNERLCISAQLEYIGATMPFSHAIEVDLNWNKHPYMFKEPVILIKPSQIEGFIKYLLRTATLRDNSIDALIGFVTKNTYINYNPNLYYNNVILPCFNKVNVSAAMNPKIARTFDIISSCFASGPTRVEESKKALYNAATEKLIELLFASMRLFIINRNDRIRLCEFAGNPNELYFQTVYNDIMFNREYHMKMRLQQQQRQHASSSSSSSPSSSIAAAAAQVAQERATKIIPPHNVRREVRLVMPSPRVESNKREREEEEEEINAMVKKGPATVPNRAPRTPLPPNTPNTNQIAAEIASSVLLTPKEKEEEDA